MPNYFYFVCCVVRTRLGVLFGEKIPLFTGGTSGGDGLDYYS